MNNSARAAGVIFLFIIFSAGTCLAGTNLLGMSNNSQEDVSHMVFIFDKVPEFDVSRSGQRVRVKLADTDFGGSFKNIAESLMQPPLMAVKTGSQAGNSIVDLYFRKIPEFVDVTVDERYARFTVNVFWDPQKKEIRPGIFDQRFGRLQPIHHGSVAKEMISSKYSGKWIDFFEEFQWAPEWNLPFNPTLPPFAGPLVMENRAFLPDGLVEAVMAGLWDKAEDQAIRLIGEDSGSPHADLYHLVLADCLLRQGSAKKALGSLDNIKADPEKTKTGLWQAYYRIYAAAFMSEYHQAERLAQELKDNLLKEKGLAPWFAILKSEISLAINEPEDALYILENDFFRTEIPRKIVSIRKGDAFYENGRKNKAFKQYEKSARDLQLIGRYPASLARYASLLYARQEYEKAYRYFFLLSEVLEKDKSPHKLLADYWAAAARIYSGQAMRARLMLWDIEQSAPLSEAGLRARIKLMDLDVIENPAPDFDALLPAYDSIVNAAEGLRQIREEAFFKQAVACHLGGKNLVAVRQLGRFFDDYWAGDLMHDARALLVEIFPSVIETMAAQGAYFEALTLVSKHRRVLAEAPVSYDFLHNLAQSYTNAGFLEQAATTYTYIMEFEKNEEEKSQIYLPLIKTLDELGSYERVLIYASDYLSMYEDGMDRADVFYYYANALSESGRVQEAAEMLLENKRPVHRKADLLAGSLFFEQKQYELAQCYLGRASALAGEDSRHCIDMKRAEALFALEKWKKAAAVYETLLDAEEFRGQAAFRLIQTYLSTGRQQKALNFYKKMSEMEIEDSWLVVSAQAVEIVN